MRPGDIDHARLARDRGRENSPASCGEAAFTLGKKENMKKYDQLPPLARAYYDVLTAAYEKGDPRSMVLIQPRLPDDEDYDPLEVVVLPKAVHNLCWAIAEHPDGESADALVLALQARYHPLLHWDHAIALIYEINDEMLRTAEEAGVLLLISADGLLTALIPDYFVYYA